MSIRKQRRRFQRIRRQQIKFAKVAGLKRLGIRVVPPSMLWAYSRLALALQKASRFRFTRTEWGRRHPSGLSYRIITTKRNDA